MTGHQLDLFIPSADELGYSRGTATVDGQAVVRGAMNLDILDDVKASPGAYVKDTNAVRLEVYLDPYGWNEGFESAREPVLTYFLSDLHQASLVAEKVDAQGKTWLLAAGVDWTGLKASITSASSGAAQVTGPQALAEIQGAVKRGMLNDLVP